MKAKEIKKARIIISKPDYWKRRLNKCLQLNKCSFKCAYYVRKCAEMGYYGRIEGSNYIFTLIGKK